ncbi:hypothetical protein E0157_062 [Escherichia phage SP15]|uniref:Uncharacterized protein n=1 Tax=Escherichia phage SP15 TaxID=2184265 RepID=A0A494WDU2_9CAUD|nr:hypothetical protein HWA82_gp160 [Escherichia phage SP15]BBJ33836.1 hypothetical protein E0157_062 [Escherichia phage SP15]
MHNVSLKLERLEGIEPYSARLGRPATQPVCLTAYYLAGEGGIEPTINGVKGRCANRYTTLQVFGWDATD